MAKIIDVIKYEGGASTLVWKHPREDFNILSQLIVHETQEAVFFANGRALDVFGPGRYTLETQNIPLLSKALGKVAGDTSPFHCEVYFINKVEQMAVLWGTDSRVEYIEPTYGFPLSIGASGEMTLRAENSKKLLLKLVGTEHILSQEKLSSYFRGMIMPRIKTHLAKTVKSLNIFQIDEELDGLSMSLKSLLAEDFLDYGVSLERFYVTNISKPEGNRQYERFKELHFRQYTDIAEAKLRQQVQVIDAETEAKRVVIDSQAQATKREQEGYTYAQERSFDVAEKAAGNEASGQMTGMGIGLGAMVGVGGAIGGAMSEAVGNAINVKPAEGKARFCDNCGAGLLAGAKFCDECGAQLSSAENVCAKCGYKFEREGKFCPGCGAKREA